MSDTKPLLFNICHTLGNRLQEVTAKKEEIQTKLTNAQVQLQQLFSKANKFPRETMTQLDAKISNLEAKRTSKSLSLAEEKDILRKINQVKKSKILHDEGKDNEKCIQEKKAEIKGLVTELTSTKTQLSELEVALSKVKLADRLGCTVNELKTHTIKCPAEKLGHLIGKGGVNIKKLEARTGCLITLDKSTNLINLQGNEESVNTATQEIENITCSIEAEINLSKPICLFLRKKKLEEFKNLQKDHMNVIFEFSIESSLLKMRGREEFVNAAKAHLMSFDLSLETLEIPNSDSGVVVGKGGATINRLVTEHNVSIEVFHVKSKSPNDITTVTVSGYRNDVSEAIKEIKDLLFKNEVIEFSVLVSPMVRNKLLNNSGQLIKNLQKDLNEACESKHYSIRCEKFDDDEEYVSLSNLTVRTTRMHFEKAEKIVKEKLALYESTKYTMQIDVELVPVIIGPKGSTIQSLKALGGPGANVQVDKLNGEIQLMGDTETGRNAMKDAIDNLITENQIIKVPMEHIHISDLFGQIGKDIRSKIQQSGVYIKIDDSETSVSLRGSIDKINVSADDIRQFIASNQRIEIRCCAEEEKFLLCRGAVINKIKEDHNVRVLRDKSRDGITLCGALDDIKRAEKDLRKILSGGDGNSVEKVFVPDLIIGSIIGKGGKNIDKYESTFDSIMINTFSAAQCLIIRGPSPQVELCKRLVVKDVMETKVSESLPIDEGAYNKLSKNGVMSRIIGGLPVTFKLLERSIRLNGVYHDVKHAKGHVEDIISGVYTSMITLIPEIRRKIASLINNFEELDAIRSSTGTSIFLDEDSGAIMIKGKHSNVKRAKSLLTNSIETLLPNQFAKVKFPKPLLRNMGGTRDAAILSFESACVVSLERDTFTFIVQSTNYEHLQVGVKAVQEKIETCMKLIFTMEVESWLIQYVIDKYMHEINSIQNETGCKIDLSKTSLIISIEGDNEENLTEAKRLFNIIVTKSNNENKFIELPESSISQFVGKSGMRMAQFASSNNVEVERVKRTKSRIRVKGDELAVSRAVLLINDWVSTREQKNNNLQYDMKKTPISNDTQRKFGVKIDVNSYTVSNPGDNNEMKEKTRTHLEMTKNKVVKINSRISRDKENERFTSSNASPYIMGKIIDTSNLESQNDIIQQNSKEEINKLYDLLLSDDTTAMAVNNEQEWDNSTVSSGLDNEIESSESGVSYYKSTSGFHVRL